jgi:predicted TIM-barrel fold metal-dependent hydrolase
MGIYRRQFFRRTASGMAAIGLAPRFGATGKAAPDAGPLVDDHVYVGQWPFERFEGDETMRLMARLREAGVTQAWAGSFEALLHKDVAGVNGRLVAACAACDGFLVPFGAVNPVLPDWEDDLRRCHEVHGMRGVRLHPNYHGYSLEDKRFSRLLELAASRKLIVQLVARLPEVRRPYLSGLRPEVDLAPLAHLLRRIPDVQVKVLRATSLAPR